MSATKRLTFSISRDDAEGVLHAISYYISAASENYGTGEWGEDDEQEMYESAKRFAERLDRRLSSGGRPIISLL